MTLLVVGGALAWWRHSPSSASLGGAAGSWWQRFFAEHTIAVSVTTTVDPRTIDDICSNTKQGRLLVTDEHGFVCATADLDLTRPGCCLPPARTGFERFSCETCDPHLGCCQTYEFCVSCCLGSENRAPVDALRRVAGDGRAELRVCAAVCRTSSLSITGMRQYRERNKHCFAIAPPRSGFIRVVGNEAVDRN